MQINRERRMELVELAANEQDSTNLSDLVREIDALLGEKQDRLNRTRIPSKASE